MVTKRVHYIVFCISLCLKYYRIKILKTRNERLGIDEDSELLKSLFIVTWHHYECERLKAYYFLVSVPSGSNFFVSDRFC